MKEHKSTVPEKVALGVAALFAGFIGYVVHWESQQPKENIRAPVVSVDLITEDSVSSRPSYQRILVKIKGDDRIFRYYPHEWDGTVKAGDTVDMVVRKSYQLFGNDLWHGLSADDHK